MLYGKDAVSACQTSNSNMIRMSGSAHLGAVLPTLTLTTLKLLVRETASFPAELLSLQCIKCVGTWDFAGKAHSAPQVRCWIFLSAKEWTGKGWGEKCQKRNEHYIMHGSQHELRWCVGQKGWNEFWGGQTFLSWPVGLSPDGPKVAFFAGQLAQFTVPSTCNGPDILWTPNKINLSCQPWSCLVRLLVRK